MRIIADRYEVVRLIARGGFADVFLAEDTETGQPVAVKLLRGEFAPNEVAAWRRLHHPHIARLLDAGSEDGRGYLVLEYVPGQSLREFLAAGGRLSLPEAARLAAEVSSALEEAHAHGILHNDIKPENIVLAPAGAKLLDFGAAVPLRETLALEDARAFAATLGYVAPEVLAGAAPSVASDIYSLAVVLVEALTGANPGRQPATALAGLALPPAASDVLRAALSANPQERPASARSIAEALLGAEATVPLPRRRATAASPAAPAAMGRARDRSGGRRVRVPAVVAVLGLGVALIALAQLLDRPPGGERVEGESAAVSRAPGWLQLERLGGSAQEATPTPAPTATEAPAVPPPEPSPTPRADAPADNNAPGNGQARGRNAPKPKPAEKPPRGGDRDDDDDD